MDWIELISAASHPFFFLDWNHDRESQLINAKVEPLCWRRVCRMCLSPLQGGVSILKFWLQSEGSIVICMSKVPELLIYTMKGLKKMLSELSSKSSRPVFLWCFHQRVVFRTPLQTWWIFPFKLKFWAGSHLLCIRQLEPPAPAVRMIGWKMIHPTLFSV